MTTQPGTLIPVQMITHLTDGTTLQTPQWIIVWDEQQIDATTAHATIALAVEDPRTTGHLTPSGPARRALFEHGHYVVSHALAFALDLDRERGEYTPLDPQSNSTAIMREHALRDVAREGVERLTSSEVTTRVGVQSSTWRAYVTRGQAPQPDGHFDARTPYWLASTIDEWKASRPRAK